MTNIGTVAISSGSAVTNNNALLNGGSIYTEVAIYGNVPTDYANLTTESDTRFSGNSASAAYVPPINATVLYSNIEFTSVSVAEHPLNNYDINYRSAKLIVYNVTYDANGGIGSHTGPGIAPGGKDMALAPEDIGISHEGYDFVNWNTAPDGSEDSYDPNDMMTLESDVTLYAQWTNISETPGSTPGEPPSETSSNPSQGEPSSETSTNPSKVESSGFTAEESSSVPMDDQTESGTSKTGDDSNMTLWIYSFCVSLVMILLLLDTQRRKKN